MAMDTCSNLIGKRVRFTLHAPAPNAPPLFNSATLEADIFALDAARGQVVCRRAHAHTQQKGDYFIIPASLIEVVELLRDGEPLPAVPHLGLAAVERRLAESRKAEERRLETLGAGVTALEQKLFDELLAMCVHGVAVVGVLWGGGALLAAPRPPPSAKAGPARPPFSPARNPTLPPRSYPRAKWSGKAMVLDDLGLTLSPPYSLKDVAGGDAKGRDYIAGRLGAARQKAGMP